jgi:hypothetical protein
MSLAELLPHIHTLSPEEKKLLFQTLAREIQEDEVAAFRAAASLPFWGLHDSYEAAAKMQELLEQRKEQK